MITADWMFLSLCAKNITLDEKSAALTAEAAQREQVERRMCEGVLRPIGHGDEPNSAELLAFVDWAALPDNRLKLRVLELAFEDSDTVLRVASRSDRAMQACMTLSPRRRTAALKLFANQQRDLNANSRTRVAACWLALEFGSSDTLALEECLTWMAHPSLNKTEPHPFCSECISDFASHVPSLSNEQITRAGDKLIEVFGETTNCNAREAARNALAKLASKLTAEQRVVAIEQMITALDRIYDPKLSLKSLVEIARYPDPSALDRCCRSIIASLLDLYATSDRLHKDFDGFTHFEIFHEPTLGMVDRRMVAALLQQPGCCNEPREYLLQRFEELNFHDGRHVFLIDPESESLAISAESSVPQPKPEPPPRRFHTIHDAAACIEKNWPDFDLEATMPATWRGEL